MPCSRDRQSVWVHSRRAQVAQLPRLLYALDCQVSVSYRTKRLPTSGGQSKADDGKRTLCGGLGVSQGPTRPVLARVTRCATWEFVSRGNALVTAGSNKNGWARPRLHPQNELFPIFGMRQIWNSPQTASPTTIQCTGRSPHMGMFIFRWKLVSGLSAMCACVQTSGKPSPSLGKVPDARFLPSICSSRCSRSELSEGLT